MEIIINHLILTNHEKHEHKKSFNRNTRGIHGIIVVRRLFTTGVEMGSGSSLH